MFESFHLSAELKILVCDTVDRTKKLLANSAEIPSLKTIIIMSDIDGDLKKEATEKELCIYTFEQVEVNHLLFYHPGLAFSPMWKPRKSYKT